MDVQSGWILDEMNIHHQRELEMIAGMVRDVFIIYIIYIIVINLWRSIYCKTFYLSFFAPLIELTCDSKYSRKSWLRDL